MNQHILAFIGGNYRPPSMASVYQSAYLIGLLILIACTWIVLKFVKSQRVKLTIRCSSAVLAIAAALVLHQDYHISRARICWQAIQAIQEGHGQGLRFPGPSVSVLEDGTIMSSYGSPDEVAEYLDRKRRNPFCRLLMWGSDWLLTSS